MKRIILILLSAFLSPTILAVGYTYPSLVTNISIGSGYARIKVEDSEMIAAEGCSDPRWYLLEMNQEIQPLAKEMYSLILTAKASQTKVHFQLTGCEQNYARITHVYNCNKQDCTN